MRSSSLVELSPSSPSPASLWLRQGPGDGAGEHDPGAASPAGEAGADHGGRRLVCVACGQPVTTAAQRMALDGGHLHTFVNPHGLVFEIGCFAIAPGARPEGPPSTEFSWFPGHAWQVAVCARCQAHLGWRYLAIAGGGGFYGLIVAMLREESADDAS